MGVIQGYNMGLYRGNGTVCLDATKIRPILENQMEKTMAKLNE